MSKKVSNSPLHTRALVNRALKDGRVTDKEAKAIVADVKRGGVKAAERRELKRDLLGNIDRFDAPAQMRIAKLTGGISSGKDADPAAMSGQKGARYQTLYGSLIKNGIRPDDVIQGQAGDCYFLSSLSALAKTHPEIIRNAMHANKDGTVTVTFYDRSSGTPTPVPITVDRDVLKQSGSNAYDTARNHNEIWPEIMEKAYAKWKGNYTAIGSGGWPGAAMEALTGQPATSLGFDGRSADDVFGWMASQQAANKPIVASTGDRSGADVQGGIVKDHAYTVLSVQEQNGVKTITLRNPWGNTEPGKDGKNDGIFTIPFDTFMSRFLEADSLQ